MDIKFLILGLIIGLAIGSVITYYLTPTIKDKPIPPRIDFITTDLDTCTVEYVRGEFCQDIMRCSYEDYPSIMNEYWCTCSQ